MWWLWVAPALLWVGTASAAPVAPDQLGAFLADIQAKHQAPFLLAATWDTVKPVEKLVASTGVQATVRRVADELPAATQTINEQIARGDFACAVFVGLSSTGNYSVHQFGSCDLPPAVTRPPVAKGPLPADPARVGTLGVSTLVAPTDLASALGGFDPAAGRERVMAELVARKWPTADKPRYVATGSVREATCAPSGKTTCAIAVYWTVTDTARQAPVYEVLGRGTGTGADARTAGDAALVAAFDSLLSRPLLQARLDPAPSPGADPAPDWTGEILYRSCDAAPQALPASAGAFAAIGRTPAGGPAVVISPDGLAIVAADAAAPGLTVAVGDRSAPAAVLRVDATLGLAAVDLDGEGWACVPFGGSAPSAGSKVYAPAAGAPVSGAVTGVQSVASLQFARSNLKIEATGTPVFDAAGTVRAVASPVVAFPGLGGAMIGVPASVILDRLDLKAAAEPDANATAKAGKRGAALPALTVDTPDPPAP